MSAAKSPAHADTRNATIRRYLLRDLAKAGCTGNQMAILLIIMDECYGWLDKNSDDPKRRRDRADFDYEYLAQETELSYDAVSRAMRQLQDLGILHEYRAPTKITPGEYGIISDPSKWRPQKKRLVGKNCDQKQTNRSAKTATNPEMGRQKLRPISKKTATNVPEKADNQAILEGSNIDHEYRPEETPIIPLRDSEILDGGRSADLPRTPEEAMQNQAIPTDDAVTAAEKAFTKRSARPLRNFERSTLRTYFELQPKRGTLLAIWIRAVKPGVARHLAGKKTGETHLKTMFNCVYDIASTEYAAALERTEKALALDQCARLMAA